VARAAGRPPDRDPPREELHVGLTDREAGLAAALLSAALFTLYFGSQVLDRLLNPSDEAGP
jgi:hypothetical protein